jgi:hypothetical protein
MSESRDSRPQPSNPTSEPHPPLPYRLGLTKGYHAATITMAYEQRGERDYGGGGGGNGAAAGGAFDGGFSRVRGKRKLILEATPALGFLAL